MSESGETKQVRDEFLKSRNGAIIRCASFMIDSKRPDMAKEILTITKIDRSRFAQIKAQSM